MGVTQFEKKKRKKKLSLSTLPTAVVKKHNLSSFTVGFLSLVSATANLRIIHKTFTLSYPSVDKSKKRHIENI